MIGTDYTALYAQRLGSIARRILCAIAIVALAVVTLSLCGCVTATYTYTRTDPSGVSCSLAIDSGRKVTGPIAFQLTTCDATVNLGGLGSPLEQLGAQVVNAAMPALLGRIAPTIPAPIAPAATVEPTP